ncbi:hypothetical protein J6590_108299 [Homalodisca vitripennis]|nr:hypothetical protein J6590_108299 [Homalodisca vitripennis]
MAPRKKIKDKDAIEKRREQKKLSMRRAREKIKLNHALHEEVKKTERERWHKRKESGNVVGISTLSKREQRALRRDWRQRSKKYRREKKRLEEVDHFLDKNTPPNSPECNDMPQAGPSTSRVSSRKKIARKNREKMKKDMEKLQEKCEVLEKRVMKYKKRIQRMKETDAPSVDTPRKCVAKLIVGNKNKIKKQLLFGEVIRRQIEENFKGEQSKKIKKTYLTVLTGKIVKKYKFMSQLKKITGTKKLRYSHEKIVQSKSHKAKKAVIEFLECDKNSRMSPGKKDTLTKHKVKKQKRLLNDSLINLHKSFIEENPEHKDLSYTTFCRLRPFYVVIPNVQDRETCLCKTHVNTNYIVRKLRMLEIISENSPNEIIKTICCSKEILQDDCITGVCDSCKGKTPCFVDEKQEKCLERKCQICRSKKVIFNTETHNLDEVVCYDKWILKNVPVLLKGKEKIVKKNIKENIKCTKRQLMKELIECLPRYMQHVANINHQYHAVDEIKKKLDYGHALLHMDFSENYNCKYAAEIQSAHFGGSKPQVTLHTSVLYYRSSKDKIEKKGFVTVSENNRHDPAAIVAHLDRLIPEIKALVPNLTSIHFLSDGPSTQYRNKVMFFFIGNNLQKKFGVESLMWHYSESGHGKGAPDGVGGYIKRTADALVARGEDIPCYETLIQKLKQTCKGVKVLTFNESVIDELDKTIPSDLKPFKGTTKIHEVTWAKDSRFLQARRLSCLKCLPGATCIHYGIGEIKLFTGCILCQLCGVSVCLYEQCMHVFMFLPVCL